MVKTVYHACIYKYMNSVCIVVPVCISCSVCGAFAGRLPSPMPRHWELRGVKRGSAPPM